MHHKQMSAPHPQIAVPGCVVLHFFLKPSKSSTEKLSLPFELRQLAGRLLRAWASERDRQNLAPLQGLEVRAT